jgi:F-type H+-transporting ATPase subunit f
MASLVPLKEALTEVKLRELPSWILMRDFTPQWHCRSLSERV